MVTAAAPATANTDQARTSQRPRRPIRQPAARIAKPNTTSLTRAGPGQTLAATRHSTIPVISANSRARKRPVSSRPNRPAT